MNAIGRFARCLLGAWFLIGLPSAMAQVTQVTDGTTSSTACTSFTLTAPGTVTLFPGNCIKSASVVTYPVTVTKSGSGTGTVTSTPGGVDCGATCTGSFNSGVSVALTAMASAGSVFSGWSGGGCSGTGSCNVTVNSAQAVTATFSALPTFALTVTKSGTGTGTVTSAPAGIACGATCTTNVAVGGALSLSAVADAGSVFVGWTGACSGIGACALTVNAAVAVDAVFVTAAATPTLTAAPSSLDFGGQSMATTSPARTFKLTNISLTPVTVSGITIDSAQFAQANSCTTLVPGDNCTISVTFSPPVAAGPLLSTLPASAILSVASSAPVLQVPLAGSAEKSLVAHYYRSVLRRAPDAGGKAFWEGEATRVVGLGADVNEVWYTMATAFYFSSEYASLGRDDVGFVTDLYNTFFNRAPDAGGLAYWTGQIAQGLPRQVVLLGFMFSPEFASFSQGIFGTSSTRKEIDTVVDFYRGLLARMPDDTGFANWVGQFRAAQCQGAGATAAVGATANGISSSFINSAEYASRARNNPQFVGDLYNALLRRGGDLAGVQFWISQLDAGASRDSVRAQFLASTEFTARINAIVAQGCQP